MKKITLETAAKYAKYLKPEVDLEEYRLKMEVALNDGSATVIEAAREAAR
jgi:hypothetical protein